MVIKNLPASAGEAGSIPGSERSPGEGNDSPLECSCLGNATDRGTWQPVVHGSQRAGHDLVTKQQHEPCDVCTCWSDPRAAK